MIVSRLFDVKESLINSAAHLRRIFSRLLPVEKSAVRQVLPIFFAVAYEKICTGSAPPHLIIASLIITRSDPYFKRRKDFFCYNPG